MKLTLINKKKVAAQVWSFIFKPDRPFSWKAGQFLHYTLPHANPDNRKMERYFTISSAPFEKFVQLTTRIFDKHSSLKDELSNLKIGNTILADGLDGDFIVENSEKALVFIAGGIGITPYRAILLDLDHKGVSIKAKLFYMNKDNNFIFKDELEALKEKHNDFEIYYFISPLKIDETVIINKIPNLSKPIFYISGPEPMVEFYEKLIMTMGIDDKHLKRDFFPGYEWP